MIKCYDHPDNFFFIDHPYIHGYSYGLEFDHDKLKTVLGLKKGRWLLTLDDCADARELFKEYRIEGATRQKGINRLHGDMDYAGNSRTGQ